MTYLAGAACTCDRCGTTSTDDTGWRHTSWNPLGLFRDGADYCPACWAMIGGGRAA